MRQTTLPRVRARLRLAVLASLAGALAAAGGAAPAASGSGSHAFDHAAEHDRQRAALRDPRVQARLSRAAKRPAPTAATAALPAEGGRWEKPFAIDTVGIHTAVLPTGKVMLFNFKEQDGSSGEATLWDPRTRTSRTVDPPLYKGKPANLFCAGQSFLPDGRLLVTGGQLENATSTTNYKGLHKVYTFNPWDETWTEQPDMRDGRWYPTQSMLPDGRTLILDGLDASGRKEPSQNNDIEVFTPSRDLNGRGTVTLLGERVPGGDATHAPAGSYYPHMFLMPSGRTLVAGPDAVDSWMLDPLGPGFNYVWSDVANPKPRIWNTGVLTPKDTPGGSEVALIGGGLTAQRDTQTFDERTPSAGWRAGPSLQIARSHHNTVLLPDASMVTIGGGAGTRAPEGQAAADPEQRQVELFDPATQTWRLGPAQEKTRTYHSTAALLPDGRVLSAGDDTNGGVRETGKDTAELYSPPYLFKGARPRIDAAPATLAFGQRFSVRTPDDVAKAVLIAPAAVTHAVDMNQRFVPLTLSRSDGCLTAAAPAGPTIAPPGHYMLFLVDRRGVPSVASWVRVGGGRATASTCKDPTGGAPVLTRVSVPARGSLRSLRSAGLRASFRCGERCGVRADLVVDRTTARRLRLTARGAPGPRIGLGSARLGAQGEGRLTVRLTRTAVRRLARSRTLRASLRLTTSGGPGAPTVTTRRLVFGGGPR